MWTALAVSTLMTAPGYCGGGCCPPFGVRPQPVRIMPEPPIVLTEPQRQAVRVVLATSVSTPLRAVPNLVLGLPPAVPMPPRRTLTPPVRSREDEPKLAGTSESR